ncbi:hypothetical protein D9615_010236 [Tricholomella constricta]|uniref:Uncharacterized protein n=1 Tax=Tricholomella constricta TaxID=117010 RepID=A0A8H5GRH9_9AGAR|nr:hypothetical protein D9615_010236 [Tricholomella constricta]
MSGHLHPSLTKMVQTAIVVMDFIPAPRVPSLVIGEDVVLTLRTYVTAMYPSIVVVLVSRQRSTVETFGFSTQVGFQSVQDIELSSVRPASPARLSVAVNPLDGKTHMSSAAAWVSKEANADGGPARKVSATSTDIDQIRAHECT